MINDYIYVVLPNCCLFYCWRMADIFIALICCTKISWLSHVWVKVKGLWQSCGRMCLTKQNQSISQHRGLAADHMLKCVNISFYWSESRPGWRQVLQYRCSDTNVHLICIACGFSRIMRMVSQRLPCQFTWYYSSIHIRLGFGQFVSFRVWKE